MNDTFSLVPVTVVGGYLGAGKTTLINSLLAGDHGRRLAVLVNDFGAVNIDVDLIVEHDGATISLANGCVCCSIADSLGETLDQVLALEQVPDQIIIEASGVADPANVAAYGQGWPGCRLDAVVVLADVETIKQRATDQFVGELVTRQLARADLLVLTKTDLIAEERNAEVRAWIATMSAAPIVATGQEGADISVVLDCAVSAAPPNNKGGQTGAELFESAVIDLDHPADSEILVAALDALPAAVVRVKGVVEVRDNAGTGRWVAVQRVGNRTVLSETVPARSTNGRSGSIVVIALRGAFPRGLGAALGSLS